MLWMLQTRLELSKQRAKIKKNKKSFVKEICLFMLALGFDCNLRGPDDFSSNDDFEGVDTTHHCRCKIKMKFQKKPGVN